MSIIIKKTENGYQMEQNGVVTHENLKVIFDKRKCCGDIKLPENSLGKKWLSESVFGDKTEIDLFNLPSRSPKTQNDGVTNPNFKGWIEYLTEDEKEQYNQLKEIATKRMQEAKAKETLKSQLQTMISKNPDIDIMAFVKELMG